MDIFIKSHKDFRTIHKASVETWNVPIATMEKEYGSIVIPKVDQKNFAGDMVYFNGAIFLIDESSPEGADIQLKVSDPINLFSRKLTFPNEPAETYGEFISDAVYSNFVNCEDEYYALPFVDVINADDTPFDPPDLDSASMYSLVDVIMSAREHGVVFTFRIIAKRLVLIISTADLTPHNIIFSDGHSELEDESFSRSKVSKVTVLKSTDTSGQFNVSTWYLSAEGDISTDPPENRADGSWEYIQIGKDDDPQKKASEEFAKNLSSHKVKFYSDRSYAVYDTVRFLVDNELLVSKILSIFYSSEDSRWLYTCGDLATTLTEKVQKLS